MMMFKNYIMRNAYQAVDLYTIVYDRIFLETTVYFSNHDRILLKRPYILRITTVYWPYANRMKPYKNVYDHFFHV